MLVLLTWTTAQTHFAPQSYLGNKLKTSTKQNKKGTKTPETIKYVKKHSILDHTTFNLFFFFHVGAGESGKSTIVKQMKWDHLTLHSRVDSFFFSLTDHESPTNTVFSYQNYPQRWLLTWRMLGVHHHHLQQHPAVDHGHREGHEHTQHQLRPRWPAGNDGWDGLLCVSRWLLIAEHWA